MKSGEQYLWVERYRPQTIDQCILPQQLKDTFNRMVDENELPNMLLTGTAGLGKTTVARALCQQLGLDYIVINGSENGNIDTLRTKIRQFASTVSMSAMGKHKVVILDEADYLNPQSTQPALRGFIEEFADNCRFILTCNFKNKVIEPLHSRCSVYEFNVSRKDTVQLMGQFMQRLCEILEENGVQYDKDAVAALIKQHAPDWRRVLNEAQRHQATGLRNSTTMSASADTLDQLISALKEKNFTKMRKWVVDNGTIESSTVFRTLYDRSNTAVVQDKIPHLILILADYQYKDAFVADHELNLVACLTEIMSQVDFK